MADSKSNNEEFQLSNLYNVKDKVAVVTGMRNNEISFIFTNTSKAEAPVLVSCAPKLSL